MRSAQPYLNFPGNAEEAFGFYRDLFGAGELTILRFRDLGAPDGMPEEEANMVANLALPLGDGSMLMASDVPPSLGGSVTFGDHAYVMLTPDDREEAERVFAGLAAGGTVGMELQTTAWAEAYGTCTDRFGVPWMINYEGNVRFEMP